MNPLKKLAGQTAIYGLPTIIGRLLNYLLVPLYTYNFSKAEYGTVNEMYAYVSFLLIILTYGMETALFNFSVTAQNKEKVYSTILLCVGFTSAVFISGLCLFARPVANAIQYPGHPEYIIWFGWILGLDAVSAIAFAKLREQNRAKTFAVIKAFNISVNIFFNLFFIVFCEKTARQPDSIFYSFVNKIYDPSTGIGYIFISNLIASALTLLVQLPAIFKVRLLFDYSLLRTILPYALPLLVAGLAGMTNETIDRILLKYLLPGKTGLEQNGIYGACYKISIIMTIFYQTFRYAAEPFFFAQSLEKDAKKIYASVMNYFVIVCMIIFLGTMLNISWIQHFVGPDFRSGIAVVPILLMANFCLGAFFNLSIWYKLTGKTKWGAYLTISGALITLAGNFIFIPKYGYMACAWTTLACYASMMVLSYIIGNRHYKIEYDLKKIFFYTGLALAIYILSEKTGLLPFNLIIANLLLFVFVFIIWLMEKRKFFQ